MDDIYDWSSKFAERLDDLEEVKFSCNSSVYNKSANDEFFFAFFCTCRLSPLQPKAIYIKGAKIEVFAT